MRIEGVPLKTGQNSIFFDREVMRAIAGLPRRDVIGETQQQTNRMTIGEIVALCRRDIRLAGMANVAFMPKSENPNALGPAGSSCPLFRRDVIWWRVFASGSCLTT